MSAFDWAQVFLVLGTVIFLTPIVGSWMANVLQDKPTLLNPLLGPLEAFICRAIGVKESDEMSWRQYLTAVLVFHIIGVIALFGIQMAQGYLPLNPQQISAPSWHLALNTAISFVTNTNWQSYAGESTLSYFTQMVGLTVQNFISAAAGISVLLVLMRGFARKTTTALGNFWVDMTKIVVHVLLPISIIWSAFLISQGVIQNFNPAVTISTVEGDQQTIPQGPAASQVAIKQLGTNGGGFFNTNSAHPYENPTPFSNFLQMVALILLPSALTYMFGHFIGNRRQGWVLFGAMLSLLVISLGLSLWSEYQVHPVLGEAALMEGKETRIGVTNSILWSSLTTAASNGSVNAMHSSLSPLSGGLAMLNIMLGEIIFGGVGSGLYGMVLFAILTVFLCGLMVGRTPEYLGKKIEARDIQMTIVGILAPSAMILIGAGISVVLPIGLASVSSKGPHGLTEVLYAFASAGGNNGSAFAGLNANTMYYNLLLGIAMLVGRFSVIVPVLAIAGNLAKKKVSPESSGTFKTDGLLFVVLLISVILIVGALTFFPVLTLGPVIEHFLMIQGRSF